MSQLFHTMLYKTLSYVTLPLEGNTPLVLQSQLAVIHHRSSREGYGFHLKIKNLDIEVQARMLRLK